MTFLVGAGCGAAGYLLYRICMHDLKIESSGGLQEAAILAGSLTTDILFAMLFEFYGYGPVKTIKYCLLMSGLALIGYEDAREKKIPNRWLFYLVGIRAVMLGAEAALYPSAFADMVRFTLAGGFVSFIVLYLSYVISRHQIGLGDVKLFVVIGLYLGIRTTYFTILLSLVIAAVYGGVKLFLKRLGAKDEIAFGPFVAIGTIIILGLGF